MKTNEEKMVKELEELFENDNELLLKTQQEINSYSGDFDFVETYDLEEFCNETNNMSCYEVVMACLNGEVKNANEPIRFDGYGNLQSVSYNDLLLDASCCLDETVEWIMDNIHLVYQHDLGNEEIISILKNNEDEEEGED